MSKTKGKTIAIFSAKGGVGKSITALNLAGIFSGLGKSVLIMDLDLFSGAIATYLNIVPEKSIFNFVDDYTNHRYNSIKSYVCEYNENISFLSCPKDPRQGSKIAANCIEIAIEKASFEYDVVIIDTNHLLNEVNLTILDSVSEILVVMTNDMLDLKNVRNLVQIFNDADKKNYKVLLNNAVHPLKKYFTLYDIKNVIKTNIDYVIDSNFYIKSIDNYVSDGNIVTLNKKMAKTYPRVYKAYVSVCNELMEETK